MVSLEDEYIQELCGAFKKLAKRAPQMAYLALPWNSAVLLSAVEGLRSTAVSL